MPAVRRSTAPLPAPLQSARQTRDTVLFYCPEMEDLARKIADQPISGGQQGSILLAEVRWEKFKARSPRR